MTAPLTPEQRAFEAALAERLAERARLLLGTEQRTVALLRDALGDVQQLMAAQPADWKLWQLTRIRDQLQVVLGAVGTDAGTVTGTAQREAWQQGEDFVDKPLAAAGVAVEARLATLDAQVLSAMRSFTLDRMKDVGEQAVAQIMRELGLVTLGAKTPFEAMKAVEAALGGQAARRASTIVYTEVARTFAVATQERLAQAAEVVPGLGKQWRRSGKIHSRWNHDLMDGLVVQARAKFSVPNPNGGVDLMSGPHDPAAPPEQVIHCGCVVIPWKAEWAVQTPKAKPYTEQELALAPGKRQLDTQAKAAGLRVE